MKFFKHLPIRVQIATPIMLLTLLILLLAVIGWYNSTQLVLKIRMLTDHLAPASELVLNADRDLYQAEVALRDYNTQAQQKLDNAIIKKSRDAIVENRQQAYDRMLQSRAKASIEA
ncbi:MAG: hypothetical protein LRY40_07705 [Shewanella fodinae]|nr:hypothetical protein [Shewanella fodinae]